jgi:signal transduction histidine kinase
MTAMLMDVGRLESRLPTTEYYRQILRSIRASVEENIARVRDLSLLLRPSMLDELGLVPALRWQAREVSRRTGLKVKMLVDEFDEDLSDGHRTCIYRVVQEAIHNCVKHAHASEVRVLINRNKEGLLVSVQDNGSGFDPKQQKGLGLLGIEERVRRFGGSFCVTSRPGDGAVLSVQIPIQASALRMAKAGTA